MTIDIPALKALAQEYMSATDLENMVDAWEKYAPRAHPATVLALIERVEKAEAPTAEDIAWAEGEGKKVISGEYGEANRPSVFARLEAAEAKIKYLRQTAVTWRYSYRRQHERADAAEADAARLREALVNETAIPYSSKPGFWCYMCDGCGLDAETIAHNQPCVLAVKP